MPKLFKDKLIKEKLENFEIPDLEEKIEILKNWHNLSENKTLISKKEEEIEGPFGDDIFGKVLEYQTITENDTYNRKFQPKVPEGGQKADIGLGFFSVEKDIMKVVVELKDAKTSLDKPQQRAGNLTPVQQAFKYKPYFKECDFIIVSNFYETRLYIDSYYDYEAWTLTDLVNPKDNYFNFRRFYYLLSKNNLIAKRGESNTKSLLSLIRVQEKEITKQFYKEYTILRKELFKDIVKNNPGFKKTELDFLLNKTQKIIDRIIFIHFCEDLDLLPQGKLKEVIEFGEQSLATVWQTLCNFFRAVDSGSDKLGIPDGYNGGLFHADEKLNALRVGDEICKKFVDMGEYDFADDLSVNILGHIFEQSISDIEELKDKINKQEEATLSKRKKDGVFYTPEYIVDYIVKNSVGKKIDDWEEEIRKKHNLLDLRLGDKNYHKKAILVYIELQEKLQNITILDPACGSGAFLVKVFDFLLDKNKEVSKILEELTGTIQMKDEQYFRTILKNNIYGVDLNEESVEITKLSLWLKTAQKGKKLANLDENIKCGNSLIDDSVIAGDKAFNWETEFPQIFQKGNKSAFHVTWVTHNSRVSERMIQYKVKKGEGVYLNEEQEVLITSYILEIVQENNFKVLNYNICGDHVHILLVCHEEELPNIVRKLKGKSSQKYKQALGVDREEKFHLWAQKYNTSYINDDKKLEQVMHYISTNREKHNLPVNEYVNRSIESVKPENRSMNKGLQPLVQKMCTTYELAFGATHSGGFDVIVGNPPYVRSTTLINKDKKFFSQNYISAKGQFDLYFLFYEKSTILLNKDGELGFITPIGFLNSKSGILLRKILISEVKINRILDISNEEIFEGIGTYPIIFMCSINGNNTNIEIGNLNNISGESYEFKKILQKTLLDNENYEININLGNEDIRVFKKIEENNTTTKLSEISINFRGTQINKVKILRDNELENYRGDKNLFKGVHLKDVKKWIVKEGENYVFHNNKTAGNGKKDLFTKKKILIPRFVLNFQGTYDENSYILDNIYIIILNDNSNINIKFLLSMFNSKLFNYYYLKKFSQNHISGGYFAINGTQLNSLSVKNIPFSEQIPFIEKADFMLENNKIMGEKVQKFLKRVQGTFELEKLSKKLQSFYELEFSDFVKELKKAKVTLSLKNQDEWEEYFESYKAEIVKLKAKIDACDREIDEMVFDLYGLSEEEREVVINS